MAKTKLSYNIQGKRTDVIGTSDLAPGMLKKLQNHDIPTYMYEVIEVRNAITEELLFSIPAHTGQENECCETCK